MVAPLWIASPFNLLKILAVAYLGFFQGGDIQFLIDIQYTHIIFMLLYNVVLCTKFGLQGGI